MAEARPRRVRTGGSEHSSRYHWCGSPVSPACAGGPGEQGRQSGGDRQPPSGARRGDGVPDGLRGVRRLAIGRDSQGRQRGADLHAAARPCGDRHRRNEGRQTRPLQKPMTRTVAEAEEFVAVARETRMTLKCGFNHRHHPAIWEAKRLLDGGHRQAALRPMRLWDLRTAGL